MYVDERKWCYKWFRLCQKNYMPNRSQYPSLKQLRIKAGCRPFPTGNYAWESDAIPLHQATTFESRIPSPSTRQLAWEPNTIPLHQATFLRAEEPNAIPIEEGRAASKSPH
jgi:hypothetical protein